MPPSNPCLAQQRQEREIAEAAITSALKRFERETGLQVVKLDLVRHAEMIGGTRDLMACWISVELPRR